MKITGEKVKDCPFCGSENIWFSVKTGTLQFETVFYTALYCRDCNSYGPRTLIKPSKNSDKPSLSRYDIEKDKKYMLEALEKWNKRKIKL